MPPAESRTGSSGGKPLELCPEAHLQGIDRPSRIRLGPARGLGHHDVDDAELDEVSRCDLQLLG
jgi:hypothetical protein